MSWEQFLRALSPLPGDEILDVGAGKGAVATRVMESSKGGEVYAVDPNNRRVASMKKDHPQLKSSVGKAESLPFPDSFFDKAYTTMALHHFGDLDRALQEFARVLKHDGKFVVLEVDPRSGKGRLFRFFARLIGEHLNMMTEEELVAKLRATEGFAVVSSSRQGSNYLVQLTRK